MTTPQILVGRIIFHNGKFYKLSVKPSMKWNCNGCDFHGHKCLCPNKDCANDGITPLVWAEVDPPNANVKDYAAGALPDRKA
jgi:hypothetical protein